MPWKQPNPSLTNSSAYLEPRITAVETTANNNTASLAESMKQQLGFVNIQKYDNLIPNKNTATTPADWDWTPSLNQAITDLEALGTQNNNIYSGVKKIFFPDGQFKIKSILIQNMQNLGLVGVGWNATQLLLDPSNGNTMFQLSAVDTTTDYFNGTAQGFSLYNLSVRNPTDDFLNMSGNRVATAIQDNGCGSVSLEYVKFRGFKNGYYATKGGDFTRIGKCEFDNCDQAIYFGPGSEQFTVERTDFMLCGECIVLEGAPQGVIKNNTFINSRVHDITILNNDTTRAGISNTYSTDYNLCIDDCWFESAAGGMDLTTYNWIFQHHIFISGTRTSKVMKGIKVNRPTLVSGSLGYPTKTGGQDYSFLRAESGTYYEINDLKASGNFVTCIVSLATSFFPNLIQRNSRIEDGYTIPLWNRFGDDNLIEENRYLKQTKGGNNTTWIELNRGGSDPFRIRQDANGIITMSYNIGGTWFNRVQFDTQNSRLLLNGTIIGVTTVMPTSGTYNAGDELRNKSASILGTAGSQYIVTGWKRLTTGSNHVLNTDWVEMRTLTGS